VTISLLSALLALSLDDRAQAADPSVAAVGDMACWPGDPSYNAGNGTATACRQRYVSDLLVDPAPTALLDLGDNQYDNGDLASYRAVYDPTFGRANAVVFPSLGNAEYDTGGARGFFDYFASAGVTSRIVSSDADASHFSDGYYSFDIGAWHLIALNSNCRKVGGCGGGSPQEEWLKNDLAANPYRCTLAYWHHPRWNTGELGDDPATSAFWTDLYNAHADLVLNGHGNHHYERFAPRNPGGALDAAKGVREFIASTGGQSHGTPPKGSGSSTSQVTDYTSFGVLALTLHAGTYDWRFMPEVGGSFTDSGTGTCHWVTAQKPATPSVKAVAGNNVVHLSWTAPPDGGTPITGYKLYRGTSAGDEKLLESLDDVTSFDDTAVTNGTKYYYRVSAVNRVGEGSRSSEVSATPASPPPPPPPPPPPLPPPPSGDFAGPAGGPGPSLQPPGRANTGTTALLSFGKAVVGRHGEVRVSVRCKTLQVTRCRGTLSIALVRTTQTGARKKRPAFARYSIGSIQKRTIKLALSKTDARSIARLSTKHLAGRRLELKATIELGSAIYRQTSLVVVKRMR
jgi:hypothetical protein